jgi:hypothetical protein
MNRLTLLLTVVAACKGGDKDKGERGSGKGGCETHAAKPAELVTAKTPAQMLAPFDKIALGMSRDEVAKLCPNFFADKGAKDKKGTFNVNEIVGKFGEEYAQARFEFVNDKLDALAYSLPASIGDALTAQWGAPKVSSGAKPGHAWFDEAKQVRAILGPPEHDGRRQLVVSKYMPLAAFIEPDQARIAWKPQNVLGKKPEELEQAFPQYKDAVPTSAAVKAKTDEMMKDLDKEVEALGIDTKRHANVPEFELPATPFGSGRATKVMLYTNDDMTIRSYGLWFRTASLSPELGWPEQSAQLLKLLDEKWGPPKTIKETLGEEKRWYDAKQGLRASARIEKPEDLDITFARYTPIANVFGAPGTTWGFEKPERPLIGATPDEIKAAYKEYEIKHDEKAGTVTMYLPPTDYESDTARMYVLMFVRKGGKVGDYRFNVPYRAFEGAKAEYEAALLAKLGKPGKEKYGEVPYGKHVKVRWGDITKSLEIVVGEQ